MGLLSDSVAGPPPPRPLSTFCRGTAIGRGGVTTLSEQGRPAGRFARRGVQGSKRVLRGGMNEEEGAPDFPARRAEGSQLCDAEGGKRTG